MTTRILNCSVFEIPGASLEQAARETMGSDIFELTDGSIQIAVRVSVLTWHGRDARKSIKTNLIKRVYCGYEEVVLTPDDYARCIEGVYKGVNSRAWKNGVAL